MTQTVMDQQKNSETWLYTKAASVLDTLKKTKGFDGNVTKLTAEQLLVIQEVIVPNSVPVIFVDGLLNEELSKDALIPELAIEILVQKSNSSDQLNQFQSNYLTPEFFGLQSDKSSQFNVLVKSEFNIKKILQLIFISTKSTANLNPVLKVELQSGAQVEVVQTCIGINGSVSLNNRTAVKYTLNQGANLRLRQLQFNESVKNKESNVKHATVMQTQFEVLGNSKLEHLFFSLGGDWVRNECEIQILGPGANVETKGLSFTTGTEVIDHATLIDHQVGGSSTRQIFKAIVAGESKSSFTGKVFINKGANKAFSDQLSRNLILTKKAEANSRPQLQVYADDVQATHGATFGQLNEEEVFYLCSRGISDSQARQLLTIGFAEEMLVGNDLTSQFLRSKLHAFYKGQFGY